jgi:hypothetical protein
MTHWLSRIPYVPAWSGWATIARTAQEATQW